MNIYIKSYILMNTKLNIIYIKKDNFINFIIYHLLFHSTFHIKKSSTSSKIKQFTNIYLNYYMIYCCC